MSFVSPVLILLLFPHSGGDAALLGPEGVGIDSGGLDLSVAHPFPQHVERHGGADGGDAVAVPEPLRAAVRAVGDAGGGHDLGHSAVAGGPGPGPERRIQQGPLRARQTLSEAMHHVEGVEVALGHRNAPVDARAALFEGLEDDGLAGQVDASRRDGQGLGEPAAGEVQQAAEGADLARGPGGGGEEGGPFLAGEVQASALGVEELGVVSHLNQNISVLVQSQTALTFRNRGRSRRAGNRRAGLWLVRSVRIAGFLTVSEDRAPAGRLRQGKIGRRFPGGPGCRSEPDLKQKYPYWCKGPPRLRSLGETKARHSPGADTSRKAPRAAEVRSVVRDPSARR